MNNIKKKEGITLLLLFLIVVFLITPPRLLATEKKNIVLLPFVLYTDKLNHDFLRPGIKSIFTARLAGEGLDVIEDQKIALFLNETEHEGVNDQKRAEAIAGDMNAQYAIFGSVTALGGGYSLDFAIIDLVQEQPRTTRVSHSVEENKLIITLGDVANQFKAIIDGSSYNKPKLSSPNNLSKDQFAAKKKLFFRPSDDSYGFNPASETSFRMQIMSLDTGDLDGDGIAELILLTRKKIYIYHGNDKDITFIDSYKGSRSELFFAVSVGDADKNGKDELYVAGSYGGCARTTVFEWQAPGQFDVLFKKTGHIRFVKDHGGGSPVILYQNSQMVNALDGVDIDIGQGYDQLFKGSIYEVKYDTQGNQLEKLAVSGFGKGHGKGPQFHTLIRYDMGGDGQPEYIGLSKEYSKLAIWNTGGKMLWMGDKKIGGTNNILEEGELPLTIAINAPPMIADVDGDGKPELLAIDNIALMEKLTRNSTYTRAKLYAYKIRGSRLSQAWVTKKFEYSIAGLSTIDKMVYLALVRGKLSNISKGESYLIGLSSID